MNLYINVGSLWPWVSLSDIVLNLITYTFDLINERSSEILDNNEIAMRAHTYSCN